MPRGEYDRSLITRSSEYVRNRKPDYLAWRVQRLRDNNTVRAARIADGRDPDGQRQHQGDATEIAMRDAISETIARTRREIVAELANDAERTRPHGR